MKFNMFHLMPWDTCPEIGGEWPVNSRDFETEKATDVYANYIDTMAYAEECGWDLVGCNEHHFSPYGMMSNPNLTGNRGPELALMGE